LGCPLVPKRVVEEQPLSGQQAMVLLLEDAIGENREDGSKLLDPQNNQDLPICEFSREFLEEILPGVLTLQVPFFSHVWITL